MSDLTPIVVGIEGMAAGEHVLLAPNLPGCIGRSSACEVSLQRMPRYLAMTDDQRLAQIGFQSVSRRHVTVTITGGTKAKLENHSQSGTFCDDVRFDRIKMVDLGEDGVTLRLAPGEVVRLMVVDQNGLDQLLATTRPMPVDTTRIRSPEDQVQTVPQPRKA